MSKRKFDQQIKVNLKREDYERIALLADGQNATKSEYIRRILDIKTENAPKVSSKKVKVVILKVDPELLFQVSKIGNNLNQIAKKLHVENYLDSYQLIEINHSLKKLVSKVKT